MRAETAPLAAQVRQLLWLKRRHMRTELVWWGYMAGTDLAEDADIVERIYQLYVFVIVGGATASLWGLLLDGTHDACAAIGPVLAPVLAAAACCLPLAACAVAALRALARPPLRFTHADVTFIASGTFDSRALMWSDALVGALGAALLFTPVAYLAGVAYAAASGLPVPGVILALALGIACAATWTLARAAGFVSLTFAARGWAWRVLARAASVLVVVALIALVFVGLERTGFGAMLTLLAGAPMSACACAAAALAAALVLVCGVLARDVDIALIIEQSGAYASLYGVRRVALSAPDTYRELRRRYRVSHRRFRPRLPMGEGVWAPVAKAAQTHLRQPEGLGRLAYVGLVVAPFGSLVFSLHVPLMLLAVAAYLLVASQAAVRELSLAFREDQRVRLVRDALPFGTLRLAVLDGLPAFACVLLFSLATLAGLNVLLPALVTPATFAIAALLVLACALASTLDGIEIPYARRQPSCVWWLLGTAATAAALSFAGPIAVIAGLAIICLLIVCKLERGV